MLSKQREYRLAKNVMAVETNGEFVLMDYDSGKYFGVRGAAKLLIEPLRDGMDFARMTSLMCEQYRISAEVAEADLNSVLAKLVQAGLVLQTDAP